ncbi:MAG: stage III sporulation protein AB [bacterium]|nr:stage III sporulation protein AB [bacterium]
MMIKIFGVIFIVLATAGIMLAKEEDLQNHRRQLEQMALFLSLLQNEICNLRHPLPKVLSHLATQLEEPYQSLCTQMQQELEKQNQADVGRIWRQLLTRTKGQFVLSLEEYVLLLELGGLFVCNQVELFDECYMGYRERLQLLMRQFYEGYPRRRKINRYTTVIGGIFVILILL